MSDSSNPISITITSGPSAVLARVAGELDLATGETLVDRIRAEHQHGASVVLDMSDVSFVDSSGLRALIVLQQDVVATGGDLSIVRPSAQVRALLDLTLLNERFHVDEAFEG